MMHILMDDGRLVHAKMGPSGHWVPDEQERVMSEQVSHKSELRKRYEVEWGETVPDGDSDRPSYIPWLEARLSKMEEALGDGGDLEYAADLLQTATNDHGVDQLFDNNPYSMSDYLRKLAAQARENDA